MESQIALYKNQEKTSYKYSQNTYQHVLLPPQNGATSVDINTSGGYNELRIPGNALSKFNSLRINFNLQGIRKSDGSVYGNATKIPATWFPYFDKIQFGPTGGMNLVDVQDCAQMNKNTAVYNLNYKKRDKIDCFLFNSHNLNRIGATNAFTLGDRIDLQTLTSADFNDGYANIDEAQNYHYLLSQQAGPPIFFNDPNIYFSVAFKDIIPDSIFNMNVDFPHSEEYTLKIWFANLNNIIRQNNGTAVDQDIVIKINNISYSYYKRNDANWQSEYDLYMTQPIKFYIPMIRSNYLSQNITAGSNMSYALSVSNYTSNKETRLYKYYMCLMSENRTTAYAANQVGPCLYASDNLKGIRWIRLRAYTNGNYLGQWSNEQALKHSKESCCTENSILTHELWNSLNGGFLYVFGGDPDDKDDNSYNNESKGLPFADLQSIILQNEVDTGTLQTTINGNAYNFAVLSQKLYIFHVIITPIYIINGKLQYIAPQ